MASGLPSSARDVCPSCLKHTGRVKTRRPSPDGFGHLYMCAECGEAYPYGRWMFYTPDERAAAEEVQKRKAAEALRRRGERDPEKARLKAVHDRKYTNAWRRRKYAEGGEYKKKELLRRYDPSRPITRDVCPVCDRHVKAFWTFDMGQRLECPGCGFRGQWKVWKAYTSDECREKMKGRDRSMSDLEKAAKRAYNKRYRERYGKQLNDIQRRKRAEAHGKEKEHA